MSRKASISAMDRVHHWRALWAAVWVVIACGTGFPAGAAEDAEDAAVRSARAQMVAEIRANADAVGRVGDITALSEPVLAVLGEVPRHQFVPPVQRRAAYDDRPLPIGYGQTISQPYIVALMTDLIRPKADYVVLEVGTGSGYQAAVLGQLVRHVYTVEIIPALANEAAERLNRLGYDNVTVRASDGYFGWPEHAPFDSIVVTAAAGHVPPPLIQQLKPGGRMIIPVGGPFFVQHLMLVEKHIDGTITSRQLLPVRFVPLTGQR